MLGGNEKKIILEWRVVNILERRKKAEANGFVASFVEKEQAVNHIFVYVC